MALSEPILKDSLPCSLPSCCPRPVLLDGAPPAPPPSPDFTSLRHVLLDGPVEVLENISFYLTTPSLLAFRCLSHATRKAAEYELQQRLTRLYLHPSRVDDVVALLESERAAYLLDCVIDVIVLGVSAPDMKGAAEREMRFHPWPGRVGQGVKELSSREALDATTFKVAYERILTKLPTRAVTLVYMSPWEEGKGWCGVTQRTLEQYAERVRQGHANVSRSAGLARWSDTEVLLGVLAHGRAAFDRVILEQPLPCHTTFDFRALGIHPYYDELNPAAGVVGIDGSFRTVTQVTVTVPGVRGYGEFMAMTINHLPGLVQLHVLIKSDIDKEREVVLASLSYRQSLRRTARNQFRTMHRHQPCWPPGNRWNYDTIDDIFCGTHPKCLPHLKRVMLGGLSEHADTVHAMGLVKFCVAHKASLRGLKLMNVTLTANVVRYWQPMGEIWDILDRDTGLVFVQFELRKWPCDYSTRNSVCVLGCLRYKTHGPVGMDWGWASGAYLELWLEQAGVPLDEDGRWRLHLVRHDETKRLVTAPEDWGEMLGRGGW